MLCAKTAHGHLPEDSALRRKQVDEGDTAHFARHSIRANAIQERLGVLSMDVEFRETAEIQHADALMHGGHFGADHLEDVVAPVTALLGAAVQGEPFRALPAEGFRVHAALRLQCVVQGTRLARPARRLLLSRGARDIGETIVLECLCARIALVGKTAEAPRIEFRHVDLGIAVEHPLREVFAAAAALRDPEGAATAHPVTFESGRRTQQRRTVRGVRNGAVDHAPDADLAEDRHALDRALQARGDALQVVRKQFIRCGPLGVSLRRPCLLQTLALIDAHESGLLLLAQIAGGIRVADHRNFLAALEERRDRVGHHVMMLHVGDGRIGADHLGHLARVTAGGIHHHARDDGALLGHHVPLAARSPVHRGDPVVSHDGGAEVARALGERIAQT